MLSDTTSWKTHKLEQLYLTVLLAHMSAWLLKNEMLHLAVCFFWEIISVVNQNIPDIKLNSALLLEMGTTLLCSFLLHTSFFPHSSEANIFAPTVIYVNISYLAVWPQSVAPTWFYLGLENNQQVLKHLTWNGHSFIFYYVSDVNISELTNTHNETVFCSV